MILTHWNRKVYQRESEHLIKNNWFLHEKEQRSDRQRTKHPHNHHEMSPFDWWIISRRYRLTPCPDWRHKTRRATVLPLQLSNKLKQQKCWLSCRSREPAITTEWAKTRRLICCDCANQTLLFFLCAFVSSRSLSRHWEGEMTYFLTQGMKASQNIWRISFCAERSTCRPACNCASRNIWYNNSRRYLIKKKRKLRWNRLKNISRFIHCTVRIWW